jgi:hypothetical protein
MTHRAILGEGNFSWLDRVVSMAGAVGAGQRADADWTWTNQRDQLLGQLSRLQFDDDLDRQLNDSAAFQSLWLLSLAEPVAWNDIAAGTDAFSFGGGDKAKLMEKLAEAKAVGAGTEKLSHTAGRK